MIELKPKKKPTNGHRMDSFEGNDSEENLAPQNEKGEIIDLTTASYRGLRVLAYLIPNIITFQQHFQPHDTDIIVATKPKSGTTWLKSLVYSIAHRTRFSNSNHPLLTKNPHELVPTFEIDIFTPERRNEEQLDLFMNSMASPRVFATHLPYHILQDSIKLQSKCKIVYMVRNVFDSVVSLWKFLTQIRPSYNEETSFEDFVDSFCRGEEVYGPYWDHVLGYWNESLERPNKVLFLTYENMHEDGILEMKKLAKFLGHEFSEEEEREGVIQEILRLCSFENLKKLEVNKTGSANPLFKNNAFFRKGKVGDWINHLNPSMVEKLDQVMKEKFAGSGLQVQTYSLK